MASFLEQLEHADMLLQTYRSPDLEDVLTLLDTVLQAAELGSIQYESVVRIQVQRQSVRIDTEWRTRCHAEGMVKSEESKVYAKREPLWRTLRHERSECGEGDVNVSTEWARLWSARCCAQTSTYELPRSIVEAEDPAGAAQYWAREQKLAKAHDRVERAQAGLRAAQAAYDCAMEQNHL